MKVEELVEHFPILYHMAADGSWPSIREHGLLSTTALLDLFEYAGQEREAIEMLRRPTSVTITHPVLGRATIRDQAPMSDAALTRWLTDMTPSEWYRLLNGKVFFWLGTRRLNTLLDARLYRDTVQTVVTVDTAELVGRHEREISLAHINTGATHRGGSPRGRQTFKAIADYPFHIGRRSPKAISESVAELAVNYGVTDVVDAVLEVVRVKNGQVIETVVSRGR